MLGDTQLESVHTTFPHGRPRQQEQKCLQQQYTGLWVWISRKISETRLYKDPTDEARLLTHLLQKKKTSARSGLAVNTLVSPNVSQKAQNSGDTKVTKWLSRETSNTSSVNLRSDQKELWK